MQIFTNSHSIEEKVCKTMKNKSKRKIFLSIFRRIWFDLLLLFCQFWHVFLSPHFSSRLWCDVKYKKYNRREKEDENQRSVRRKYPAQMDFATVFHTLKERKKSHYTATFAKNEMPEKCINNTTSHSSEWRENVNFKWILEW